MTDAGSRLIVPAEVDAEILRCDEGLSFWGGVDPETGRVIDAHHSLYGESLAGKAVVMPTSRGSCSGSGVLLQLALNGCAPAALIFRETEEILTLGAIIAQRMYACSVAVVRLAPTVEDVPKSGDRLRLTGARLTCGALAVALAPVSRDELALTGIDRALLAGARGKPAALAAEIVCAMAASQGARRLIDVTRGHIDGCIYAHEANLTFAETMAEMGAQVAIPTTINAISVDRENWTGQGLPQGFAKAACRLADAYVRMGARPTFTCAPYLSEDAPRFGEAIGWSESNAVIYANSVLGARTCKHADYLDLFIALTGRAPETGVYLTENRQPGAVIEVDLPDGHDDAVWPLLGWIAGRLAPDRIPLLAGLEKAAPRRDDLRALCAAFGTTSAAPMLHVAGVTPEADLPPTGNHSVHRVSRDAFADAWRRFNTGSLKVDLVALGSPHFSFEELERVAQLMEGQTRHARTRVTITLARETLARARCAGLADRLHAAGVRLLPDMCWCSIVEPVFPPDAKTVMTNSGKYAHYAPGLSGRKVRFGGLADCVHAARTGFAPDRPPAWLA